MPPEGLLFEKGLETLVRKPAGGVFHHAKNQRPWHFHIADHVISVLMGARVWRGPWHLFLENDARLQQVASNRIRVSPGWRIKGYVNVPGVYFLKMMLRQQKCPRFFVRSSGSDACYTKGIQFRPETIAVFFQPFPKKLYRAHHGTYIPVWRGV